MKSLFTALALAFALAGGAQAASHAAAAPTQQDKMKACNKDAGDKKGDERKAFMKSCLSAKKESTQQDKMKSCNKSAGDKKGDDRKAFMKECLSKKA
jgi:psiF repeat